MRPACVKGTRRMPVCQSETYPNLNAGAKGYIIAPASAQQLP